MYELAAYGEFSNVPIGRRKQIYRSQLKIYNEDFGNFINLGITSKFEKKTREILNLSSNVVAYWVSRYCSLNRSRERRLLPTIFLQIFLTWIFFTKRMDKRERQLGIIAHSFVFTTIENRTRAHIRSGRVDARTRSIVEILHAGEFA